MQIEGQHVLSLNDAVPFCTVKGKLISIKPLAMIYLSNPILLCKALCYRVICDLRHDGIYHLYPNC